MSDLLGNENIAKLGIAGLQFDNRRDEFRLGGGVSRV